MTGVGVLRFSLRGLHRDWRAGELHLVGVALIVAIAAVTSVGFFGDRVRQSMLAQAGELLAADLALVSSQPFAATLGAAAAARGLRHVQTLTFPSVVVAGDKTQLAEIKAVEPGYPLRGVARSAVAPGADEIADAAVPGPGEAWVEPRLLNVLGLHVGGRVAVGAAEFVIARVITFEPDRGGEFFSIGPRLLMNRADIAKTELVQPGSRVTHRLLLAGDADRLAAFRAAVAPGLGPDVQWQGPREARPELRVALERAERFLGLAALVSVLLAGVAIATAARRYAARHYDAAAIMRCLGATQGLIAAVYALQMLWLGLLASLAGCALGYLAQAGLSAILSGVTAGPLALPSLWPVVYGVATGLVILLGFALAPLSRLKDVSPLRVLRRDLVAVLPPRALTLYGLALASIVGLMYWQTGEFELTAYLAGATAATLVLLGAIGFGLVRVLSRLRARVGVAWRFGLANIARRARVSVVQMLALGLGIMVLLLLSLVRADLLAGWQRRLPPDAPNHFLINIQPHEAQAVPAFLAQELHAEATLYPMVRGRLTAINARAVTPLDYADGRARRLVEREFNLSWAATPQTDNRVVAGTWWSAREHGRPLLSVEAGLAETLGIRLHDELTFRVAERELTVRVASLRTVEWDSFRVNFFAVTPPGVLEDYPATYVTSFHLGAADKELLSRLVARFPSVTVIDVDAIMMQVRRVIERVTTAVEYVFLFTVLAGLVVLYSAIQASRDERLFEGAILRTLGAHRRALWRANLAEFATLGALAGLLAALAATVTGYILARFVLKLDYQFNYWVWLIGPLAGAVGVGLAGAFGTRRVVTHPPLQALRALG